MSFFRKQPDLSFAGNVKKRKIISFRIGEPPPLAKKWKKQGGWIAPILIAIGVEASLASTIATVVLILYVAYTVYSVVSSLIASSKSSEDQNASGGFPGRNPMSSGHLINTRTTSEPVAIPYGTCRLGGNLVYISATGTTNEYLHMVMTLGEGPVSGIDSGELMTLDVAPGGTGWMVGDTITGGSSGETCDVTEAITTLTYLIKNRTGAFTLGEILSNGTNTADQGAAFPTITTPELVWLDGKHISYYGADASYEFFTGTSSQTVCATLQAADPLWDDAMRYTAYIYMKLTYNEAKFASMPNITLKLNGRLLYDPRNSSTAFSDNPALVVYDFMNNERYSLGIPSSSLDTSYFNAAATWCDDPGLANLYTFNGPIMKYQAFIDNLDDILKNFRAGIIWSEGQYKLIIYEYDTPIMTLTENDIVADSFRIVIPGIPETPNRVVLNYIEAADNYLSKQRVVEDVTAVLSYDGEERDFSLDLIGTDNATQAEKLGAYYVKRNRLNYQYSFNCRARALALEPLDMVIITHYLPGWDEAILRVIDVKYSQGDYCQLTVIDDASTLYDDVVDVAALKSYGTNLPVPTNFPASPIADGSITTPKIAANAVTYVSDSKDDNDFSLDSTSFTDILTLGATSHGGEFSVDGRLYITNYASTGNLYFQLTKDSTVIDGPIIIRPSTIITTPIYLTDLNTPSTGTITYKIQGMNDSGSTATLKYRSLKAYELLK